jgi:hypothetical protein
MYELLSSLRRFVGGSDLPLLLDCALVDRVGPGIDVVVVGAVDNMIVNLARVAAVPSVDVLRPTVDVSRADGASVVTCGITSYLWSLPVCFGSGLLLGFRWADET